MTSVPRHLLYYGGFWVEPKAGNYRPTYNPASGEIIAEVAQAGQEDVDAAVEAAAAGFAEWRQVAPLTRARALKELANRLRANTDELAELDARNGGNPIGHLKKFVEGAAQGIEFFAGLVTEMKGASIPMGTGRVNFSIREPFGVVARIVAYNHPLMFAATRLAAPIASGNALILKPSEQAPLSALRLADLSADLFPPGVLNVITGGAASGEALSTHPGVAMITLIGSVETGKALMRSASNTLKPVLLELGGKNALIAYPDCDPSQIADAVISGMNFTWAGQSCGSTSRAFLHEAIHDQVADLVVERLASLRPGLPIEETTQMGAIVSPAQRDRILEYIKSAKAEGAKLLLGGGCPAEREFEQGWFIEPTVFSDVTPAMRVAKEEIFGPVLSLIRWSDEKAMLSHVNGTLFGLTCSIWTNDIRCAMHAATEVEAGYVWINEVGKHFLGTSFGGYKMSGVGREEGIDELLSFTQEKNVHLSFSDL